MRVWALAVALIYMGCASQPVYVLPDGTRTSTPPPGYAPPPPPPPPPSAGPSAGEVALGITSAVLGGIASGLTASDRKNQLHAWIHINADEITKCLHGTATPKGAPGGCDPSPECTGKADLLWEDFTSSQGTMKARLYWSGGWGFAGSHNSEITVTVSGDSAHPIATVSVDHEDANFQYEINFRYADALATADRLTFFRMMTGQLHEDANFAYDSDCRYLRGAPMY